MVLLFIIPVFAAGCKCIPVSEYETLIKKNQRLTEENRDLLCEVMALEMRVYCLEENPILVEKQPGEYGFREDYGLFPLSRYEFLPRRVYAPRLMRLVLTLMFPHLPFPVL